MQRVVVDSPPVAAEKSPRPLGPELRQSLHVAMMPILLRLPRKYLPWDWAAALGLIEHTQVDFDAWGDFFLDSMTAPCSHAIGGMLVPNKQGGWPLPANPFVTASSIATIWAVARPANAMLTQLQL